MRAAVGPTARGHERRRDAVAHRPPTALHVNRAALPDHVRARREIHARLVTTHLPRDRPSLTTQSPTSGQRGRVLLTHKFFFKHLLLQLN